MKGEEPAAEKAGRVNLEKDFSAMFYGEADAFGVDAGPEHGFDLDRAERRKQVFQAVRVHAGAFRVSGFAGVRATLSPQPQAEVSLGLEKEKVADRRSTLKSICAPSRNSTALGSISSLTPLSSTISSRGETVSANSMV